MKTDKRFLCIQILALLGFVLTIKLAIIYYNANYNDYALMSFCSINDFIDCDGAAKTTVSQVFGIPLAYWGMLFYLTVFFLTIVDKLKKIRFLHFLEVFKCPLSYIAVLGIISFIISIVLAAFSLFVIRKLCILCLVTYFIDLFIAGIASDIFRNTVTNLKETFCDFIDGAKKYPKTFIVLLIAFTSFITYSGVTNVFLPHVRKSNDIKKYAKMKHNPYKVTGNTLGNPSGDVVIDLYSDFVCPHCYIQNIMLHRAAQEYSNVKVIHHNLPFDKECNAAIPINAHPGACVYAKAAMAAGIQGNYWGMSTFLYENRPKNKKELRKHLKDLNLDEAKFFKDFESAEIDKKLKEEVFDINDKLGIDATPTMYVNGDKKVGITSYELLRKYLEEHGATRTK